MLGAPAAPARNASGAAAGRRGTERTVAAQRLDDPDSEKPVLGMLVGSATLSSKKSYKKATRKLQAGIYWFRQS